MLCSAAPRPAATSRSNVSIPLLTTRIPLKRFTPPCPSESFSSGRSSSATFRAVQTEARRRRIIHLQQPVIQTEPFFPDVFTCILKPVEAALLGIVTLAVIGLLTISDLARGVGSNGLSPGAPTSSLVKSSTSTLSGSPQAIFDLARDVPSNRMSPEMPTSSLAAPSTSSTPTATPHSAQDVAGNELSSKPLTLPLEATLSSAAPTLSHHAVSGSSQDAASKGLSQGVPTSSLAATSPVVVSSRADVMSPPQPAPDQFPAHAPHGYMPGSDWVPHPGPDAPYHPPSAAVGVRMGAAEGDAMKETLSSPAQLLQAREQAAAAGQRLAVMCSSRLADARYGAFMAGSKRRMELLGWRVLVVQAAEADFRARADEHAWLVASLQLSPNRPTLPSLVVYDGRGGLSCANRVADFAQLMAVAC